MIYHTWEENAKNYTTDVDFIGIITSYICVTWMMVFIHGPIKLFFIFPLKYRYSD